MVGKIVPRTEVMPCGGIRRIERRPVIEFSFEEVEQTALTRWMKMWGPEFFPKGTSVEKVEEVARDPSYQVSPIQVGDYTIQFQVPSYLGNLEDHLAGILKSRWGIDPLNCVKKKD